MVVLDACNDARFATNPLVTGEPGIRFYAGAPISVRGQRIGSLCVISREPRLEIAEAQLRQLVDLADFAGALFELKDEARVRARTAAELIKEEWRHALTLEAGKVGSWVWDFSSNELTVNDILRRMYGFDPDEPVTAERMAGAVHPEDRVSMQAALRKAVEGGRDYFGEFRMGQTGRWYMVRGRVYQRDTSGRPLVMMGVHLEITDTKLAAENTRVLLRELNHRVKNTLAMIQSLARQTLKRNPDPQAFMDAFSGRLRTLSEAHVLLSNRDWAGIDLRDIIETQRDSDLLLNPAQMVVEGENLELPPDHALGLGLILHELASNAARHGALSTPNGTVTIRWHNEAEPSPHLVLDWTERGGPKVTPPKETGLGLRLIERGLAKVLDSDVKLSFPPEGVQAHITFPLPA